MGAQLNFEVNEQTLTRCDKWNLMASESQNYLRVKFAFKEGGLWVPSETSAVFISPKGLYATASLDENGECLVPNEVLTDPGVLTVSLYYMVIGQMIDDFDVASNYTSLRLTTNPVGVYIHPTLPVFHSGGES